MRLPVGKPLAESRGLMMLWLHAMISIVSTRPFWVTLPFTWPDFCPVNVKYAFSAIEESPFASVASHLDSVYALLRAGR
jgi:hypothetical protein